jgi:hypothetical protein
MPIIIACTAAVRWTVDSEDNERRELENNAAAFSIERGSVNTKFRNLRRRWVTANVLVLRKLAVRGGFPRGREDTENAFFGADRRTRCLTCVYGDARIALGLLVDSSGMWRLAYPFCAWEG